MGFCAVFAIAGGVVVAPFAARLAGRLPQHVMGTLVGGLILIVNGQIILFSRGPLPEVGLVLFVSAIAVIAVVAKRAYAFDLAERASVQAVNNGGSALEGDR